MRLLKAMQKVEMIIQISFPNEKNEEPKGPHKTNICTESA